MDNNCLARASGRHALTTVNLCVCIEILSNQERALVVYTKDLFFNWLKLIIG
jgi:hypothetical protein